MLPDDQTSSSIIIVNMCQSCVRLSSIVIIAIDIDDLIALPAIGSGYYTSLTNEGHEIFNNQH